ncbi:MAG: helix-turn-helix transcriptional regulator [Deltaproteobacteria bacterium]|nr:helix-turn-helix transcriptional regulator [Deltaproteobacteria bacterium]
MTHEELKKKALSQKAVKKEYDELSVEFSLLMQLLSARKERGLTQADIAEKMGTKAPAITRLESSLATGGHSPSLTTLRKYASALGYSLSVKLVRV